ncbi:MAG: hypothetical protein A3F16_08285 [Deltaproteobacteria bacterium RIFCSPHIGHO2_12_FULL_43_9]|nr:MAG: hypothetical protein A3F16_08285 [Deltaproteobacteria bacterium RIFCSPHIGHO2_12_FULL_43_9]
MKKISLLSIALFLYPIMVFATPVEGYNGTFTIAGKHEDQMKGSIHLFFEDDAFSFVKINTENPVMKKTEFDSNEQKLSILQSEGVITQFSVAYKLQKPLHKNWYFVFVAYPTENAGEFAGNFFKVMDSLDNIETIIKNVFNQSNPIPAEWKGLGTGVVTKTGS